MTLFIPMIQYYQVRPSSLHMKNVLTVSTVLVVVIKHVCENK